MARRLLALALALAAAASSALAASPGARPPTARVEPVTDLLFG